MGIADIGYPPDDASLTPLRDQVYERWLAPAHTAARIVERESARYKSRPGVPVIDGRARRCASQEGNALYATLALGLADERTDQLAANLTRWQWPDGGWNCDRKTEQPEHPHSTRRCCHCVAWRGTRSKPDRQRPRKP